MESTDYITQTATKAAFEDLIWSRPERKSAAGKLLIIGGHRTSFSDTQLSFQAAESGGIGEVRVCLPLSLQTTVGDHPQIHYVDDTPSGSLAESAATELKSYISWADGLLLPGELSNNSETELLITELLAGSGLPTIVSGDSKQLLWRNLEQVDCENIGVVCSYKDLQQLVIAHKLPVMISRNDSLATARSNLKQLHEQTGLEFMVDFNQHILTVAEQQISQTAAELDPGLPAIAAVLKLQFTKRPFAALTTAVYLSVTDN